VVPAARTTPDAAAPELPLPVVPVESEATVDISPAELAALLGTPEVNPNALTATSFPALRDPGDLEPPITPTVLAPPAPVSRTLPEADDLGEDSATVALLRGFPGEPPSGPVSSGLLLAELFARQSSSSSRPITEEVLLTEDALTAIAEMAPSRNKRPLPTVLLSAPPDLPPPPSPATPRPATPPPATPRPATPVLLPPAAPEEIEAPTRRNPSLAQVARAAAEDPATKRTPALRAASQVIETATIPAPELSAQFEETLAVSEASDSFEETSESSQLTPPSASPPVEIEEFEEVYEEAGPEWAGFQSADELMAALPGYFQAGRFVDAFEQIDRLSEWEPSPISRARRYYAIALDLFQNYQQTDPALELLNEALDADPMFLESFEKIDQVLTRQRDWARLAENYRRMLGRVPVLRNDLRLMLWHALGEIYRSRLGDFSSAIGAFEEAQRIDPENPIRRQILEELYEREPSRWESAAEAHRARLQEGVTAYELRALLRVFQRAGQPQGAFWAASALRALGQATPDEEALAVQGRFSFGAGFSGESLFHSLPYALPHEDGSALVSELFGLAVPALSGLFGRSERDLGLQNARRIPPGAALPLARLIESQADALGVPRPAIFFAGPAGHDDPPDTGISILPLLGESVGVLVSPLVQQLQREKDLVFMVTRHLFYLRPEHLLIRFGAVNQPLLRVWVRALTSLVAPALVAPREGDDEALSWSRRLAPLLAPALVEQLRDVVTRAVQRGKDPSTTAWFSYVERSANRAALLACGDLESAARVLQTDTSPLSILSARAKLHDLLRFAVSAEHAALRAKG
jgi:tetratricopeptide (TPR) repeat protein